MKPLFSKRTSLQINLLCALLAANALIVMDRHLTQFAQVRYYLTSAITPCYYIANRPWHWLAELNLYRTTQQQLHVENQTLRKTLFFQKSELLLLHQLQQENQRLQQLLNTPPQPSPKRMIARLLATCFTPQNQHIVLDKGSRHGVYQGQPVINDQGLVGQVVSVNYSSCRVLLISDASHAIPVRIVRNQYRTIAQGSGNLSELQLDLLPLAADIQSGDQLVTSGLDGHFPEGYPVALVHTVSIDHLRTKLHVKAQTTVTMAQLDLVLLLWPETLPESDRLKIPQPLGRTLT